MLKRQRPTTPPPSSLSAIRPSHSHTPDPTQPHSKRPRVQPPPLDGALRGWLRSDFTGPHSESDGEEDWAEEDAHDAYGSPLHPLMAEGQYKDANHLLHELHVLNQHRLLFAHSSHDQRPNPTASILPSKSYIPLREQAPWTEELSYRPQPASPQVTCDEPTDQCRFIGLAEKELVEEVQCVRQRYEGANRLLGSLFLSRRRDVAGINTSANQSSLRA
ncbi:hypothetical protein JVU11DRAFT_5460 [Chiua virens]|nr:hypothetical protein JVU11DRAFT_5460 [Chiua virens]